MIFGNDIATFLGTAVLGAIIGSIVLVVAFRSIRRRSMAALLMVAAFTIGSWVLFTISDDVRTNARWLIHSRNDKAAILAQPDPNNGELKHAEWDAWGIAGQDNTVYLVFDPNDSLRGAAESHSPGKYSGIPCDVFAVVRLENHWYTVRFYTNTDWNHCN